MAATFTLALALLESFSLLILPHLYRFLPLLREKRFYGKYGGFETLL
jgi:hypothetical protein